MQVNVTVRVVLERTLSIEVDPHRPDLRLARDRAVGEVVLGHQLPRESTVPERVTVRAGEEVLYVEDRGVVVITTPGWTPATPPRSEAGYQG